MVENFAESIKHQPGKAKLASALCSNRGYQNLKDALRSLSSGEILQDDCNTEAKRCFATHDEDNDYFNMRIYIILIACVYIQQFNFIQ